MTKITWVPVPETVPAALFDQADEVELIARRFVAPAKLQIDFQHIDQGFAHEAAGRRPEVSDEDPGASSARNRAGSRLVFCAHLDASGAPTAQLR